MRINASPVLTLAAAWLLAGCAGIGGDASLTPSAELHSPSASLDGEKDSADSDSDSGSNLESGGEGDSDSDSDANNLSEATRIKVAAVLTIVPADKNQPGRRVRLIWERVFENQQQEGGDVLQARDIVEIKNPFGNTQARLENDSGGLQISIAGRAADGGETRRLLAMLPPPEALGYWLLGASEPGHSTREIFIPGAPGAGRIVQHGWEVIYEERDDEGRPRRIVLRPEDSSAAAAVDEATLKITQWLAP